MQSLLLEGGPTLGSAFLAAGLVDKILLFVAPKVSGEGPAFAGPALGLTRLSARRVGEDVLLSAYVREP